MRNRILNVTLMLLTLSMSSLKAQESQEAPDTLKGTVEGILGTLDLRNRLKISGYLQAQYQVADSGGTKSYAGGDFEPGVDKRFYVRRGRIKFQYDGANCEKGWSTSQYVLQFDVTQKGVTIKDAYVKITDPWSGWFSLTAGMQNRPFGFEVIYSSSMRESPERGRMSQIIFPNERDLGAMLTIQGPKISNWNWLKFDVGMFNGTGAPGAATVVNGTASGTSNTSDFDKFKDIIGHLTINRNNKSETVKWGLGASFYEGGFRQDTANQFKFDTDSTGVKGFSVEKKKSDVSPYINNREKTKRSYVGFDGQVNIDWMLGITALRAEYIMGTQPATSGSSTSLAAATTADIYSRKFNGAYLYFLQNLGHTPLQAIVKYDWYDPNTDVAGDDIGKKVLQSGFQKTSSTDIKYTTLGLGLAYRWDANVKITAYYDMVTNETSSNLSGYTNDLLDNVFTLRLQARF